MLWLYGQHFPLPISLPYVLPSGENLLSSLWKMTNGVRGLFLNLLSCSIQSDIPESSHFRCEFWKNCTLEQFWTLKDSTQLSWGPGWLRGLGHTVNHVESVWFTKSLSTLRIAVSREGYDQGDRYKWNPFHCAWFWVSSRQGGIHQGKGHTFCISHEMWPDWASCSLQPSSLGGESLLYHFLALKTGYFSTR